MPSSTLERSATPVPVVLLLFILVLSPEMCKYYECIDHRGIDRVGTSNIASIELSLCISAAKATSLAYARAKPKTIGKTSSVRHVAETLFLFLNENGSK